MAQDLTPRIKLLRVSRMSLDLSLLGKHQVQDHQCWQGGVRDIGLTWATLA